MDYISLILEFGPDVVWQLISENVLHCRGTDSIPGDMMKLFVTASSGEAVCHSK
jgi:hypothetical protein